VVNNPKEMEKPPSSVAGGTNMRPSTMPGSTIQSVMVGMIPSNQVSAASMNAQRIPSIMPSFAAVAATPQDSYAAAAAKLAVPRGGAGSATITSAAMLAGPRGQYIGTGMVDKSRQQQHMQYVGGGIAGVARPPLTSLNKMTHDQKKSELLGNLDQLTRLLRILREQVVSDKAGIASRLPKSSRYVALTND
jgi:hypothetical protein